MIARGRPCRRGDPGDTESVAYKNSRDGWRQRNRRGSDDLFRWWATDAAVNELILGEIFAADVRVLERELKQAGVRLK
jgi:hypothetical protein